MTQFYVGTAGWSYLRWDKDFYPPHTKSNEKLAFYASHFNAVELNNSFYHVPAPEQFTVWERQVPASFRFAVKASRFITHTKKLKNPGETLPFFMEAVSLQQKAGPVFFQLPPSLGVNLELLQDFLRNLPRARRYVLELRDPSWHNEAVYALLKQHNIAFCLYDTPEGISPRLLTTDFAYVRLRGRKEALDNFLKGWKKWLHNGCEKAYIFFDNREEKSLAFGNALLFRDMTKEEK